MVQPYEGEEKPTGMPISYWDDLQNTHLLGIICFECASPLCNKGIIGIGYAGFPHSWGADLIGPYKFHFEDQNHVDCECSICQEKRWRDEGWEP